MLAAGITDGPGTVAIYYSIYCWHYTVEHSIMFITCPDPRHRRVLKRGRPQPKCPNGLVFIIIIIEGSWGLVICHPTSPRK